MKNKSLIGLDKEQSNRVPFVKIFTDTVKTKTSSVKTKKNVAISPKASPKDFSVEVIKKYSYISDLLEKNKLASENFNVNPTQWELSNRKRSLGWVDNVFSRYRIKNKKDEVTIDFDENNNVKLFKHQQFFKDFLQPVSPYRGLLLFHGLGSGKSCSSIGIMEGLKKYYPILVLTPKSLQLNYRNELKKCGGILYQLNQYWEFIHTETNAEDLDYLSDISNINKKVIKKHKGVWINRTDRDSNFLQLSDEHQKQIELQVDSQIDYDYEFMAYNGFRLDKLNKLIKSSGGNMFSNKAIVIDEVHNLVSTIVNDRNIGLLLYNQLLEAENCKIVLLTGTPIINVPREIAIMANILRGLMKQYTFKLNKIGQLNLLEELLKETDTIDQFDIQFDKSQLKITRNKKYFSNRYNNSTNKYIGVFMHNNEMEENIWKDMIKEKIETLGCKVTKIEEENHKALPDVEEDFNNFFINEHSGDTRVKNHLLFKKRTSGIISYYSGADKDLYPRKKKTEIVKVPMSKHQLLRYFKARNKEIKKDDDNKKKMKKKLKGDKKEINSFYRVFSRMFSNFVFPEEIERPMGKVSVKELDADVDLELNILKEKLDNATTDEEKKLLEDEIENYQKNYTDSEEKKKIDAWKKLEENKDEYLSMDALTQYSPKIKQMIENINECIGNVFIYSQFKTLEGINTIALALSANGYAKFNLVQNEKGEYVEHYPDKKDKSKPKYIIYEGNDLEKSMFLKIFNNKIDELPDSLQDSIYKNNPDKNNLRGDILKIMLSTSSGAEGIHLENIRQVHITEPYWNDIRIQQVIGRAIRFKSHINLPEKERDVSVYIYMAVYAEKTKIDEGIKKRDGNMTTDESIYKMAIDKANLTKEFLDLMKEASVDCNLNSVQNSDEYIDCFSYPSESIVSTGKESYGFNPDIRQDNDFAYIQNQQLEIMRKGQKILYRSVPEDYPKLYFLVETQEQSLVYDYESWIGNDGKGRRPILVGHVVEKDGKQTIEFL
jgi:hypothetical protein